MDFEFLFKPLEELDAWLTRLLDGAPLLVALGVAFVLGLRHASDPDHLVATTSLVAADGGDKAIGVVILLLAARVIYKWLRGDFRTGRHRHAEEAHRHLRRGRGSNHN